MLYSNKQIQNLQNAIKKEIQEIPIQKDQKNVLYSSAELVLGEAKNQI